MYILDMYPGPVALHYEIKLCYVMLCYAQSPNYVWHVDGYDKLKPYGFCIHGAIDGYSRLILWLEVLNSNNSSGVIAKYYLDALANLGG